MSYFKTIKSSVNLFVILSILFSNIIQYASAEDPQDSSPSTTDPSPQEPKPEVVEAIMETPGEPTTPPPPAAEVKTPEEPIGVQIPQQNESKVAAKVYDLKVIRPSHSGSMYLFLKDNNKMPEVGRVFLLKNGMTPVMGFRVIKTYPEKNEIAAKKIKKYPGYEMLSAESFFKAYEKLGALSDAALTASDLTDLNELEGGTVPVPSATISEENSSSTNALEALPALEDNHEEVTGISDSTENSSNDENEDSEDDSESDKAPLGFLKNFTEFNFGSFKGKNLPGGSSSSGFSLQYSKLLSDKTSGVLAGEVGLGYYKSSGDVTIDDEPVSQSFTILPLSMRLRYHFSLKENWSYYLYGGFLYNIVSSQFGASETEVKNAQTIMPGIGVGVYIPTGPDWYLRVNLGTEFLGIGVALRF